MSSGGTGVTMIGKTMRNAAFSSAPMAAIFVGAGLLAGCPDSQRPPTPAQSSADAATRQADPPNASSPEAPASSLRSATPSGSAAPASPPAQERAWSFDGDSADAAPAGFRFARTGSGAPGRWVVRSEADAPSKPNVLAQLDADATDFRFPITVADEPFLRDLRLSVRCKMVSGKIDQACGLVFRYQDENNYYVTRANTLENNVRLYHVKNGRRQQIASADGAVAAGAWHDYRVEARGDHIEVFWDGARLLDHRDSTFPGAGKVGVWTKADSVTYFDDLTVSPVEG